MRDPIRLTPEEVDALPEVRYEIVLTVGNPEDDARLAELKVDVSRYSKGDRIHIPTSASLRATWVHPQDYLWYYDSEGTAWEIQEEEDGSFSKKWSSFGNWRLRDD